MSTIKATYGPLGIEDVTGPLQADYLVGLDAHLRIFDGEALMFSEPGFPVVELARSLLFWLQDGNPEDFYFESMSYEETGTFFIKQTPAGWTIGSIFEPTITTAPVEWPEIEKFCHTFIDRVEEDLRKLGLNPSEIIEQ